MINFPPVYSYDAAVPRIRGSDDLSDIVEDAAGKASAFGVAGVALRLFGFCCGWTLLAQGGALFVTRLVINLTRAYNSGLFQTLDELSGDCWDFVKTYPNLRLISFLFAVALCWVSLSASVALGAISGVVGGLTVDRGQARNWQSVLDSSSSAS